MWLNHWAQDLHVWVPGFNPRSCKNSINLPQRESEQAFSPILLQFSKLSHKMQMLLVQRKTSPWFQVALIYNEVYYWFFTLEYGLISMIQHLLQLASFLSALFTYFFYTPVYSRRAKINIPTQRPDFSLQESKSWTPVHWRLGGKDWEISAVLCWAFSLVFFFLIICCVGQK